MKGAVWCDGIPFVLYGSWSQDVGIAGETDENAPVEEVIAEANGKPFNFPF